MHNLMESTNLLLDSLDERGAAYRVKLRDCREKLSEKSIHDLRAGIRRLMAILDVAGYITSHGRAKKLSDTLNDQLDSFSELRDTQVMLDDISENIRVLPELEPFQDYLKDRKKRLEDTAEKEIDEFKLGSVNRPLFKIRDALTIVPAGEIEEKILAALDDAFVKVMQRYWEIDPSDPSSVHPVRTAFKNFRYMLEAAQPAFPDIPESQFERMHDYQTRMGQVQDAQVFLDAHADFAEKTASYDPTPVRRYYEQTLAERLSAYLKEKDQLKAFWRATPLSVFPWETSETQKEESQ